MKREPDKERLETWRDFLKTHSTVIRVLERQMLLEQSLQLTWYDVLVQLSEASEGQLRLQALAESTLLSRSGLTRLVDRMEAAGLVRREPCPDDRRGAYAVITEEGNATLRRAAPGHLRGIAEYFTSLLSDADARTMTTAFRRILDGAEQEG